MKKESKDLEKLEATTKAIEKKYGKGAILLMSDFGEDNKDIDVVSTGSMLLDSALGIKGIPRGRITEIFGDESVGKTTLTLSIIAQAQKKGEFCAFVDMAHALDRKWMLTLGVDPKLLYVAQPSCAEEALEITEELVRSGTMSVIVLDDVSSLVPQSEIEGEMGDSQMGVQARLMSQACRKLTVPVHETNTALVFINQLRSKIGMFFGNPDTTSGGNALKYYASVRMEMKASKPIKDGATTIGNLIRVRIKKNKLASPFRVCEIPLIQNVGFSYIDELVDKLILMGVIIKSASWFSLNTGERIGQGRESVKNYVKENLSKFDKYVEMIHNNENNEQVAETNAE